VKESKEVHAIALIWCIEARCDALHCRGECAPLGGRGATAPQWSPSFTSRWRTHFKPNGTVFA